MSSDAWASCVTRSCGAMCSGPVQPEEGLEVGGRSSLRAAHAGALVTTRTHSVPRVRRNLAWRSMPEIRMRCSERSRDLCAGRARSQGMDRRAFLLTAAAAPFGLSLADIASGAFGAGSALAFVTADLDSHVAVVDLERPRVVARIPTSAGPRSIETVGETALVAHTAHGRISLVDTGARRVRQVLEGFGEPRYTAARRTLAYVTDSARGEVVTVDVRRGSVVARDPGPGAGQTRHVDARRRGHLDGARLEGVEDRRARRA